ncbi:ArsR family transcriptional regulator [Alcanivorax sp.]|uniref:ArsR family transcriptional regulator n=1 Tax=Alcanivorax sp. TaxID=1872427 RepID=UPI003A94FDCE
MSEALHAKILQAVREIGPCTCSQLATHMGIKSPMLGQPLRIMGQAGQITKVGLTSSNAAIWDERCDRAAELMHNFITRPAGAEL